MQGQGGGQGQGDPRKTKSAPPRPRVSAPSLVPPSLVPPPPAAPPRPDQAPAQRRQPLPGEVAIKVANWQRLAAVPWQSGGATTSPEQQRSKEVSARFREMKELAETDWLANPNPYPNPNPNPNLNPNPNPNPNPNTLTPTRGEVQTALLFGNEWCDLVTETDILDNALDFFDI